MVIDLLVIFAVGLLAAVLNVILGSLLRHVSPRRIVADLTRLDVVGLGLSILPAQPAPIEPTVHDARDMLRCFNARGGLATTLAITSPCWPVSRS